MCQKLWQLVGSSQSYCNNNNTYFLAHPVYNSEAENGKYITK